MLCLRAALTMFCVCFDILLNAARELAPLIILSFEVYTFQYYILCIFSVCLDLGWIHINQIQRSASFWSGASPPNMEKSKAQYCFGLQSVSSKQDVGWQSFFLDSIFQQCGNMDLNVFDGRAGVYQKISICFLSHLTTYHWRKTAPVLPSAAQNSFKPISTAFLWTYQNMPPSQQWMIDINGKPSPTARRHIFQNSDKLKLSTDVTAPDLTLSVKFVWFWRLFVQDLSYPHHHRVVLS